MFDCIETGCSAGPLTGFKSRTTGKLGASEQDDSLFSLLRGVIHSGGCIRARVDDLLLPRAFLRCRVRGNPLCRTFWRPGRNGTLHGFGFWLGPMARVAHVEFTGCPVFARLGAFHSFVDGFVTISSGFVFCLIRFQVSLLGVHILLGLRMRRFLFPHSALRSAIIFWPARTLFPADWILLTISRAALRPSSSVSRAATVRATALPLRIPPRFSSRCWLQISGVVVVQCWIRGEFDP